jgi:hypothetical protein
MLLPGYLRSLLFKPEDGSYTVRPKCRPDSTGLNSVTSQTMALVIVTWTNTCTNVRPLRNVSCTARPGFEWISLYLKQSAETVPSSRSTGSVATALTEQIADRSTLHQLVPFAVRHTHVFSKALNATVTVQDSIDGAGFNLTLRVPTHINKSGYFNAVPFIYPLSTSASIHVTE